MEKKIALITGATGSIGKEIALFLSNKEIRIIGTYNTQEEKAKELEEKNDNIRMFHLDLSNAPSISRFVEEVLKNYSHIDFLINNAGIKKDGFLENLEDEEIKSIIDVNLTNTILLTKKLIPKIKESKGRIINISSISGEYGNIGQANYSSSKAGLEAFTRSLSKELAKYEITVNAISPGLIESKMVDSIPKEIKEKLINKIALKKLGSPRAISELVYFMLTNKENYITGQTIMIDGGLLN